MRIGTVLTLLGALLGLVINTGAVWADLEGNLFNSGLPAEEGLATLRCPILITPGEEATISATFHNPQDRPLRRRIYANVSEGFVTLIRSTEETVFIPPGEQLTLSWPIYAEDAAWDRFVLARVYSLRAAPMPSVTAACGVWRVPIPGIGGETLLALAGVLMAGLLAGGGWRLWRAGNQLTDRQISVRNLLLTLSIAVVASFVANLLAWWAIAAFTLALALVLLLVSLTWTLGAEG
jgi:hypothetical protein